MMSKDKAVPGCYTPRCIACESKLDCLGEINPTLYGIPARRAVARQCTNSDCRTIWAFFEIEAGKIVQKDLKITKL